MSQRLPGGPEWGYRTTSHALEIAFLRQAPARDRLEALANLLAADLLEAHDDTGISLDDWPAARAFVEYLLEGPITENGV